MLSDEEIDNIRSKYSKNLSKILDSGKQYKYALVSLSLYEGLYKLRGKPIKELIEYLRLDIEEKLRSWKKLLMR